MAERAAEQSFESQTDSGYPKDVGIIFIRGNIEIRYARAARCSGLLFCFTEGALGH